jgi:Fels-1 Prophage Protein-like
MRSAAVLLTAALPLLAQGVAVGQPAGLAYPQPGVVCDSVGRVCYDSYGPSIGITQINYGQRAADRLQRNLSQSNSRDFRLSTGQACNVAQRVCWEDGWAMGTVARGLTQQLFGSSNAGGQPGQSQVARDSGICRLSRGFQRVYDGPCQLKQVMKENKNRYVVQLDNGNRYAFEQQGGKFVINDGLGGTWPVSFSDQGRTGVFRFGVYTLTATQNNPSQATGSQNAAVNNAIINLLNTLFSK